VQPEPHLDSMLFAIQIRLFFGIPPESPAFARLKELYRVMDYRRAWRTSDSSVTRALEEATVILNQQLTRGEDPARCFLREMIRAHPETAHERTALWNLIYILQTSWRDLAGLLQWNLKMLSDNPVWVTRLREEAEPETLAGRVVMETLRLEQSDYLMRRATQDIRFDGFVIPRGWQVRICVRESHRSREAFAEPDRFSPDRFSAGEHSKQSYSPFGASRIRCPGEHLSLSVGRIFVRELALGFDWDVSRDGPPEYGGFHWRPSSKFRVRIAARNPAPPRVAT
jgi:cytochrome P450